MRFESFASRRLPATVLCAALALAVVMVQTLGCSDSREPAASAAKAPASEKAPAAAKVADEPRSAEGLVAEGRGVYMSTCIACHNPNPKLDGALGPAVAGASEPLIEARVLRAEYPEGYTPKRDTRNMVALPFLKDKIPALAAYLASEG